MDKIEKSEWLDAFERFLNETPKEKLDQMIAEVDAMGFNGPTVEEYFDFMNGSPNKIAALRAEIETLKSKAAKWDALAKKMDELYAEDSEADLGVIGETAAIAFGYL